MKGCAPCGRGFHEECKKGCSKCHPKSDSEPPENKTLQKVDFRKHGGTREKLKDPQSTGRKRAAILYPLAKTEPCEWRGLKNCGGGRRPIIGCLDGLQAARHHGPVKNVTRNHEGNVHRICTRCHNHWHELNDLVYNEQEFGLLPHDPVAASPEELVKDEMAWRTGEIGKQYQLASTLNHSKGSYRD